MSPLQSSGITIVRYRDLAGDAVVAKAVDDVFFTSSNTKTFADAAARGAFRERWFGRYLTHFPDSCFVAVDADGAAVGYICGSLDDPARDPHFADQPHLQAFAAVTPSYPAQLHVNVAERARGQGVGRLLIAAFAAHARAAGVPGVHAITSRGARNVRFYLANAFAEAASAQINGKTLVLLGRRLT